MTQSAIQVQQLGKKYRLGTGVGLNQTFSESIPNMLSRVVSGFRRRKPQNPTATNDFWALKDVSFEVNRGQVMGIIGPNGAGKSTLLKILSQITDPTQGYAAIRGRVASLLEVGTGFHPELSGRENIYLNGSILGMTRREIRAKFDAIVAFSGVEKFLDTPIKRYSSGMAVRLAFSVAAHLDPEILLIDEVLAVGDAQFQKRCLGKMDEVAHSGRTILFVSHNLAAVSSLCDRCLLLRDGRSEFVGPTPEVIRRYQRSFESALTISLIQRTDRRGSGLIQFDRLEVQGPDARPVTSGATAIFRVGLQSSTAWPTRNVDVMLLVADPYGQPLFSCLTNVVGQTIRLLSEFAGVGTSGARGVFTLQCAIPRFPLAPGQYFVDLWASVDGQEADYIQSAGQFTVAAGDYFGTGRLPTPRKHGPMLVAHHWTLDQPHEAVTDQPRPPVRIRPTGTPPPPRLTG